MQPANPQADGACIVVHLHQVVFLVVQLCVVFVQPVFKRLDQTLGGIRELATIDAFFSDGSHHFYLEKFGLIGDREVILFGKLCA